jgi:hypothetical protein
MIGDFFRWLGDLRVENLAEDFGVLADTVEVIGAILLMVGGIYITHRIQVWADTAGEHPGVVNTGKGGGFERLEQKSIRE